MLARYSTALAGSYFIDRTMLSNDADIQTSLRGIELSTGINIKNLATFGNGDFFQ